MVGLYEEGEEGASDDEVAAEDDHGPGALLARLEGWMGPFDGVFGAAVAQKEWDESVSESCGSPEVDDNWRAAIRAERAQNAKREAAEPLLRRALEDR